jgi:hypothetical protein
MSDADGANGSNGRHCRARTALLGAALASLFLTVLFVYHKAAWMIANTSDDASAVLEGQSMLGGNWNLSGWSLTNQPVWLTDIPLYAVAVGVFGPQTSAMKDVPALIYALTVACCVWLAARQLRGRSAVIAGLGAFVLVGLPSTQTAVPMAHFALTGPVHFGTILFGLLSLAFLLEALIASGNGRSRAARGLVCSSLSVVLLAAALAGDALAALWFVLPGVVVSSVSVFRRGLRRDAILIAVWAVGSVALAAVFLTVGRASGGFASPPLNASFVSWSYLLDNLALMIRGLLSIYGADFFGQPLLSFGTVLLLFHLIPLAFVSWAVVGTAIDWRRRPDETDWIQTILALGCIGNVLAFVFSSMASDLGTVRYLIPVLVFGSVVGGQRLSEVSFPEPKLRYASIGTAAVVALASVASFALIFAGPAPAPEERELAGWLSDNGLRHGFAEYWSASIVTVESRGLVTVRPIRAENGHLAAFHWLSSASWYDWSTKSLRDDPHEEDGTKVTFVIWQPSSAFPPDGRVSEETATNTFGPPDARYQVGTYRVLVWQYDLRPLLAP